MSYLCRYTCIPGLCKPNHIYELHPHARNYYHQLRTYALDYEQYCICKTVAIVESSF